MLNALKDTFPDDYSPEDRGNAGKKNFFKTRWPLLVLISLVLVAGAYSLFSKPKKNTVAEKILPNLQQTAPLANRKSIDKPRTPAVQKSVPVPIVKPTVNQQLEEFTYKSDAEYLALTRYKGFPQATQKPTKVSRQRVRDTVTTGDKPLTLGGRGFNFKGAQPKTETRRYANFTQRLKKPVPKMERAPKDYLDLRLTETKSSKELIFHPSSPALGKYNRQRIYIKDVKPEKRTPPVLKDIPETKLLLMETDNSLLILRNGKKPLDLLAGNEKINRNAFDRW